MYTKTVFDSATFKTLWASDPDGVMQEAIIRGAKTKLGRKVEAITGEKLPKAPRKAADPQKAEAWNATVATGAAVGSAEFWAAYKEFRAVQRSNA